MITSITIWQGTLFYCENFYFTVIFKTRAIRDISHGPVLISTICDIYHCKCQHCAQPACSRSFAELPVHNGTVEPVLKDHPIDHNNLVCQDRWSLVTGSVTLKCRAFCQKCVVCQDRWSLKTGFTVVLNDHVPIP